MEQPERRVIWLAPREVMAAQHGEIIHVRPGQWGIELPRIPLALSDDSPPLISVE